ncbi:hypothetical protein STEG23_025239 [Scotinomys teguina]
MSEVKEDAHFSANVRCVHNSFLSRQGSSNQNINDSSQTESHHPQSALQQFRNFCYNQVPGPREAASKLQELCYQWLMPETNSKKQILEALVLEQFLNILSQAMKNWVQKHHPEAIKHAVALAECLQTEPDAVPNENLLTFEDTEMHFSREDWCLLDPSQKTLYKDVMLNIYKMATSLGLKPENVMGNDQPGSASATEIQARPSKISMTRRKAAQKNNNRESHADTHRVQEHGQALPGRQTRSASVCKQQQRKPFKCHDCGRDFRVPSELARHHRVHTREKPFSCQQCDLGFRWKSDFTLHILAHRGIKPYKCSWCQKSFGHNTNLRAHQRIHTGERPFQCRICKKAFTQKAHLLNHHVVHTDERPYECSMCERNFKRKSSLLRHRNTHG